MTSSRTTSRAMAASGAPADLASASRGSRREPESEVELVVQDLDLVVHAHAARAERVRLVDLRS